MRRTVAIACLLIAASSVPASAAERVRVAVFGLFHPKQVVVYASPQFPLRVDSGQQQIVIGLGAADRLTISRSGVNVIAETTDSRSIGRSITVVATHGGDSEFILSIPGKLQRRYRGKLIVGAVERELVPIVEMDIETAVASVVAAEQPGNTPLEALKAQAVVSRSYLSSSQHRHAYADFCDTTHCQFLREPPPAGSPADIATRATAGLVLAWKGTPFHAMYSASCGGHTHSLAELGYAANDYPYFNVDCPYCRRAPERWSSHLAQQDTTALAPNDERERIKTGRKLGWHAVPSNTFTQTRNGDTIDLRGVGRGHGIGLCQRGAAGMAHDGKDFRSILVYYFPGTTIESIATR